MKSNIDLTENSDFTIPIRVPTRLSRIDVSMAVCGYDRNILSRALRKNIADIHYCIESDIEYSQRGGMIQGNGYRREYMKICEEPDSHCERCGRHKKYPWEDFGSLLCPQCNAILDYEMRKIPWKER